MHENIYPLFAQLEVAYERFDHEPFYTCEQADEYYNDIEAARVKNLFLRNRKATQYYLVVIPSTHVVDLRRLSDEFGEPGLSFASPERLLSVLGIQPGSVSPLALLNDEAKQVRLCLEQSIFEHEYILLHPPARNDVTLRIKTHDLDRFVRYLGCTPKIVQHVSCETMQSENI